MLEEAHARTGIMGLLEEISENLDSAEAKKNGFKKSIFAVLSNYKDFEKYIESTQKSFKEWFLELESREKNLNSVEESARHNSEELKLLKQQVDEKLKYVEDEEKRLVGLALKEKELLEKEKKLNEKEILINGISERLDLEKNELAGMETLVEERLREAGLEEEYIEKRRKEIKLIEDEIFKRVNKLDEREMRVEECEKMINFKALEESLRVDRERVIEMKEKEERLIRQDLELKEKEIDKLLAFHDQRVKELDMREKQFEVKKKEFMEEKELLQRGNKDLELKRREFECQVKNLRELEMIEINLETKRRELEVAEKSLKECLFQKKQCQSEKELLEDGIEELKVQRKKYEDRIKDLKELEVREKELEVERKKLEVREKQLEVDRKELEVREKQLEEERKELKEVTQVHLREYQSKEKQWHSEKELWEKQNKEVALKLKEFEDRIKSFENREEKLKVENNKLNDELRAREPVKKVVTEDLNGGPSSPNFSLFVDLDGLDVHLFLNGLKIDLSSKDEVLKALQKSGAPAGVVLNAIESLYPPYLMKVDVNFEGTVASSFIVLLEQLMKISPKIQSREREHALRLARDWKAVMLTENTLEVLGFFYLLASFHLAFAFDPHELLELVQTAVEHPQLPELCDHLGLTDKIPGVIQNLLKDTKRSLQAIELICAFELVDEFPPVPILKQYLNLFKGTGKNDDFDERISAVKAVLRCVVNHKLESQYPPRNLENTINQLSRQKVRGKHSESVVHHKTQVKRKEESEETPLRPGCHVCLAAEDVQEIEFGNMPFTNFLNCLKSYKLDPELSNTGVGPPNAMALLLANMNGKNFLSFLDIHLVDHEWLQNEIFYALRILDDSLKFVLDVIQGFCSSYPRWEKGSRSCICLLQQLIRISPPIPVGVKGTARLIAFDLKEKITAQFGSPLGIVVFLLFISGFRLVPAFDSRELLRLYKIVLEDTSLQGLCQSLGILEMISGTVNSQLEMQQTRAEGSQLDIQSALPTVSVEMGFQTSCSNANRNSGSHGLCCNQIPNFIRYSPDPAVLVLDALHFYFDSNSPKNKVYQLLSQSFFYLLKQLMNVTPKIEPWVKRRAFTIANGWKSNLSGSNSWEVLAFLQFVGVYGLSSFFRAMYLLGLLGVAPQLLKETSNLIRILSLEDMVPGFIRKLIAKQQCLLAFEFVFEFNLVDKIPPVALLKKHVSQAKLAAMEIRKDGKATPQEQDFAIFYEVSALKDVIKCILDRGLQTEYSPDELRQRVAQLETQCANLKASLSATPLENSPKLLDNDNRGLYAPGKSQSDKGNTRKRPASNWGFAKGPQFPPSKKSRPVHCSS